MSRYVCTSCTVVLPANHHKGVRNFRDSNWCRNCNNWKPKEQTNCECCKYKLRCNARSKKYVKDRKRI